MSAFETYVRKLVKFKLVKSFTRLPNLFGLFTCALVYCLWWPRSCSQKQLNHHYTSKKKNLIKCIRFKTESGKGPHTQALHDITYYSTKISLTFLSRTHNRRVINLMKYKLDSNLLCIPIVCHRNLHIFFASNTANYFNHTQSHHWPLRTKRYLEIRTVLA